MPRPVTIRRTLFAITFALLPGLFFLHGCSRTEPVWPDKPNQKKVLATFTPIYCFTQAVAGDDANVLCLLTAKGPHEPSDSPNDVLKVRGADLVIGNGLELDERYVGRLTGSSGKRNINVFYVGDVIEKNHPKLLDMDDDDEDDHDHAHDHARDHKHHDHAKKPKEAAGGHGHSHGDHDPHIWLGPDRAKKMVDIIADKLAELEPAKKDDFLKRARDYKVKLDELKAYGLEKFKGKTNKKIVSQHESLGYFAAEFGLNVVGYIKLKDGQDEGNAVKLIRICKEKRPAVFTYEPQFKKDQVEMLRNSLKKDGIDTELAAVDTIETAPTVDGGPNPDPDYYLMKMRENIDNLARVLK